MRIAHIIMAHQKPKQLLRLIKRLEHPNFDIYIHLDKKVSIEDFKIITDLKNVFLIQHRIECNWGGFSFLKAIFNAIDEVLHSGITYDFINLLSGQDYPINKPCYLFDFLLANKGTNFISFDTSRKTDWWQEAAFRYERYHFTDFNFKGRYLLQNILNKVTPKRKFPLNLELYGSSHSSWWTITSDCAKQINSTFKNNTSLHQFLKYTWGADEMVIATLIMNSPHQNNCKNNNLRYIDFSEGNAHPKTLLIEDFEKIKCSNMFFARKFDEDVDINILNLIDNELLTVI